MVHADMDGPTLMAHLLSDLQACECQVRMVGENELVVEQGTPGRGSVLSFVDSGGTIRLTTEGEGRALVYEFSTASGLLLCALLSLVCGAAAWFALDGDRELTAFGVVMPLLWLYGANYVTACIRVPGLLARLCRTTPRRAAGTGAFIGE